jgi:hypothetical protein
MGYLSSFSLDRLVRDEGSEYANAFTLMGTHPWLLHFMTLIRLRRYTGDILGRAYGSPATEYIETQG